jgi:prevent-host-death family protein
MSNVVNVSQARDNLAGLLGRVRFGEETITVEKKGKPFVVIISPAQYEALKDASKERLFAVIDSIQASNAQVNEEDVLRDITEEVETVRQSMYEKGR